MVQAFSRWMSKGGKRRTNLLPGGIRARLFLLLALVLLPLSCLLVWIYYDRYQIREAQALQTELEVAQGVATSFGAFVDGIRKQNRTVGEALLTFPEGTGSDPIHILNAAVAGYPAVRNMSWVRPDGTVEASTLPALVGQSFASRTYFREVVEGHSWALGDLLPSGTAIKAPTVGLATALRNEGGTLQGVVVAGIEPTNLGAVILAHKRPAEGAYAIFDRQGTVVYSTVPLSSWENRVQWKESDESLRKTLETGTPHAGIHFLEVLGGTWVSARVPVDGTGWVAGAGRPIDIALAPVRQTIFKDAFITVVIVSLAFFLAYLVARTISGPLRRLDRDTQTIGVAGMSGDDDDQAPTEVRHLRASVAAMANDLIQRAEALQKSEERLRQGVRVANIGIFEHDHRTGAIHLSAELQEILGWTAELPVTFDRFLARIHPEDRERIRAEIDDAHDPDGEGTYSVEHRIVRPDGSIRQLSVRSRTFFEGEGPERRPLRTVGAAVDMSERYRMEQALRSAKEAAEEANRVKSEFLANMSHELRTPLTVIMTSLEFMRDPALSGGDHAPFIEMAETSAHRLLGIIDDLLDITRLEAGHLQFEDREFDLRECVRQSVDPFAAAAREKGLRLSCEIATEIAPLVNGDPDRLGQVLENLIGNAVKFTDRGEVAVTVAQTVQGTVFTIRDTGIGIPPDKLGQLFHPFTQVDASLTRRHGGTGLGLAISKELVERMGGTIQAQSEQGRGSTFTVTLPLPPASRALPSGGATPFTDRPARVLLAEDDAAIRHLIETILRRQGMEVAAAENGRKAVARWEEGGIDVVLMDLQMPEMDGLAAARAIRALESHGRGHTPILALTAHARPEDQTECLSAGMDGFLTKPIRSAELCSKVESCLRDDCREARTFTDMH